MSINIPILSIPIFYFLASIPHGYAVGVASKNNPQNHDNRNPHGSAQHENLKKRLAPRQFAAFERAESCHRNHLENMPLFVATVFAGVLAEQRAGAGAAGLTTFCIGWLALRSAYTVNYIVVETMNWSYLRSAIYGVSTFWAFYVLVRSAMILGS